jgi:hypothetical protein
MYWRRITRLATRTVLCAVWLCAASGPPLNRAQKEEFLRNAKVVRTSGAKLGITGTTRATLSDGRITHDASVQTIDESKNQHQTAMGMELNFRDTYRFNIAAYKLDRLLGLNMIPVVVERSYRGQKGSYCWWVDDTLMVELERFEKKVSPPNPDLWNKQMYVVRVFDQLIYNTDRNLGNLVIDKEWRIWMIDHSRAFRMRTDLKEPKNLVQCDRDLLAKMKDLNQEVLTKEIGEYLNQNEIRGLLARRDKIVQLFEKKGPSALYDRPSRPE